MDFLFCPFFIQQLKRIERGTKMRFFLTVFAGVIWRVVCGIEAHVKWVTRPIGFASILAHLIIIGLCMKLTLSFHGWRTVPYHLGEWQTYLPVMYLFIASFSFNRILTGGMTNIERAKLRRMKERNV
jgi:hypothetical protein